MSEIVSDEELNEQVADAHGGVPEEIHMPSPSIAPLIVGIGTTLLLTGMIAPVLGVIGLVVALIGGLRMARFPEVDMPGSFLQHLNNRKLGMWAFIASEVMFFTSLIATFIRFKIEHGAEFEEAHEIMSLPLATIGTTVLIVSSFAVVMGLEAIQSNDRRVFFNWMGLTILFGATFLSIQAFEWYELMHEGIKADDIFGTVFFTTTGFHGLHVLGGVVWMVLILLRAARGEYSADNNLGIEIFGLYWHFVDVVWIVLFTIIYLIQ
jgi:heme/copper-type cytochrome/quinol oxidase subunit 3